MDDNDSRTICLHIPSLFPPNYSVEISMPTQSAAVVSAGMAYLKSSNRVITEMLLNQIMKKPTSDKGMTAEREGYALAAGIGMGFVNLGA